MLNHWTTREAPTARVFVNVRSNTGRAAFIHYMWNDAGIIQAIIIQGVGGTKA